MAIRQALGVLAVLGALALGGCAGAGSSSPGDSHEPHGGGADLDAQLKSARAATGRFTDHAAAESAGYASTLETLGCFHDAGKGGMGLHYVSDRLMDAALDATAPEALVYELDATGAPAKLVAHEYIVPVQAWSSADPPTLLGQHLHRHATLPLWVLHVWLYRDNPSGIFADFNPDVATCPTGVPVFGVDLPKPAASGPTRSSSPGGPAPRPRRSSAASPIPSRAPDHGTARWPGR